MKIIKLSITALLLCGYSFAQTTSTVKQTIINGTILPSPNDTIIITYYPYKLGNTRIGGVVTKHITSDGSFRLEIASMDHPYYCSIVSVKWGPLLLTDQFIEPGDSLMIKPGNDTYTTRLNNHMPIFSITGRNAAKNQAQHLFDYARRHNKITGLITKVSSHFTNLPEALPVAEKNALRHLQYWDSLIADKSLTDVSKKVFAKDFEVRKIAGILSIYGALYDKFSRKEPSETNLQQLVSDSKVLIDPLLKQLINNYSTPITSPAFLDMAVSKTMIDTKISENKHSGIAATKYLKAIEQWPADCKEEVLTTLMAYFYTSSYNVENIPEMLAKVSAMVNKPMLRDIIQNFQQSYTPGAAIFPFELTGMKGEKVSISHYKDKVVVLDFWFTGCTACIIMARRLKLVKERLLNEHDIVFMSVSIDKEKERWLNSVEKGLYTHSDFINVYTGGEGAEHPLIKRYDITSYPRVLIIGKNNKLFTSKPHIPTSLSEIDILVQTILDARK